MNGNAVDKLDVPGAQSGNDDDGSFVAIVAAAPGYPPSDRGSLLRARRRRNDPPPRRPHHLARGHPEPARRGVDEHELIVFVAACRCCC